jgi:RNA polymerase sigma factor (sigma-70 family)
MGLISSRNNRYTRAYADYFPLVYSIIAAKVSDQDAVRDLCQDTFLRLYEKFDTVENVRAWLYGAVRNVLFEFFRSSKVSVEDVESIMSDAGMSFVNGFRDSRIIIEEALENIENFGDEQGKVLFDLVALYNFTYKDAAAHLGMSERQVRYRYGLSVARILEYLKSKGIRGLEELL